MHLLRIALTLIVVGIVCVVAWYALLFVAWFFKLVIIWACVVGVLLLLYHALPDWCSDWLHKLTKSTRNPYGY